MNRMGLLTAKRVGGEEPSIFWILIFATDYKWVSYKGKKDDVLRFRRTKWKRCTLVICKFGWSTI